MLVQEPYSVRRRLTNLRFREFFVFTLSSHSSVFVGFYCTYSMSVTRFFFFFFFFCCAKTRMFTPQK